jgi:hypothetical protein
MDGGAQSKNNNNNNLKNVLSNYKNPWIICQNLSHGYIEGV